MSPGTNRRAHSTPTAAIWHLPRIYATTIENVRRMPKPGKNIYRFSGSYRYDR